jgi:hypothetical protein
MEFELERDTLNPLYSLTDEAGAHLGTPLGSVSSGSGSSALSTKNGGGGSSTDGSDQTLLDVDATPTPMPGSTVEEKTDPVPEHAAEVDSEKVNMGPSAEDILESTTSRAKPLLALERLRRIARGDPLPPSAESPHSPSETRSRRSRRGGGSAAGGGGMMDVFAVMAEINEQLGDAPDLAAFLQVVIGVIKDLSQFHRVLVYQFDEAWNGQVVAELLDWSKTHDLYRGLHFPADDIPAQVCVTFKRRGGETYFSLFWVIGEAVVCD